MSFTISREEREILFIYYYFPSIANLFLFHIFISLPLTGSIRKLT